MGKDDNVSSPLNTYRVKRRRTRGERNKIRAGLLSLPLKTVNTDTLNKGKSHAGATDSLETFINSAEEITYHPPTKKPAQNVSKTAHPQNINKEKAVFARNLKRESAMFKTRLGIFNLAKKSNKIHRVPLTLPLTEASVKKTEDDLQRVLDLSDEGLRHIPDIATLEKRNRPPIDQVAAMETCVTTTKLIEKLTESPDMTSIAKQISSGVKPSNFFPNRRYFEEKQDELRLLLRQSVAAANSMPSGEEEMNTDASPKIPSLADTHPSQVDIHDTAQRPSPAHGDSAPHLLEPHSSNNDTQENSAPQEVEYLDPEVPGMTVDALTDAKCFLACSERAVKIKNSQAHHRNSTCDFVFEGKVFDKMQCQGPSLPGTDPGGAGDGMALHFGHHSGLLTSSRNKAMQQMHCSTAVQGYRGYVMPSIADSLGPGYDPTWDRSGPSYPEESLSQSHQLSCHCPPCLPINHDHDYIPAATHGHQTRMQETAPRSYEKVLAQFNPEVGAALPLVYRNVDIQPDNYFRLQDNASLDLLDLLDQDPQIHFQPQLHLHHPPETIHHLPQPLHPHNLPHLTRVPRPPGPGLPMGSKVNLPWQHMNMVMVAERPHNISPATPPKLYPPRRMY